MVTSPPAEKRFARPKVLLHVAAAALAVGMIVVLARSLRRDGPAALEAWRAAHVQSTWVVFAVSSALAGHAIYIFGWQRLLRDSGLRIAFWPLARMFFVSNLGRYLPGGKAWQMGIVAVMAAEQQLPSAMLAASSLFQAIIGVAVGAVVVFAAGGTAIGLPRAWLLAPVLGIVAL
ncbi:MAG TPA: hypothetical protein VE967_01120, partial [Gemmatimonadaceae bacterium]|nr:hypothetical protein [Gemmatimonadaceae bacterium]